MLKKIVVVFFALLIVLPSFIWGSETTPSETNPYIKFSFAHGIGLVQKILLSPDEKMIAVVPETEGDGKPAILDITGQLIQYFDQQKVAQTGAAFSPDNKLLALNFFNKISHTGIFFCLKDKGIYRA